MPWSLLLNKWVIGALGGLIAGLSVYMWYAGTQKELRALREQVIQNEVVIKEQNTYIQDLGDQFKKQQELNLQFNKEMNDMRAKIEKQKQAIIQRDLTGEAKKDPKVLADQLTAETNARFRELENLTR